MSLKNEQKIIQEVQKLITKLFRDNEKRWQVLEVFKEYITTEIKSINKPQTEDLENTIETLNNGMDAAEQRISDLEDNQFEKTQLDIGKRLNEGKKLI